MEFNLKLKNNNIKEKDLGSPLIYITMETINQVNQNMIADDMKEKCLKTKHVNKTADINADINAYMNAYMKQKYNADPLKAKLYKNTRNYKKKML